MNDVQNAFEAALQADLAAARQQITVLTDQLRASEAQNEGLAYKVDIITKDRDRITDSREQYERVAIRVATIAESVATIAIKQLQDLRDEIRSAAFAKVPGAVKIEPAEPADLAKPMLVPDGAEIRTMEEAVTAIEQIGRNFSPGFGGSASLLPAARIGNGAVPNGHQ